MPSATSHYLLAQETIQHYAQTNTPVPHVPAFLCGAQGPDFLLIHRAFPWQRGQNLREMGRRLHRQSPSDFFECLRRWLIRHPGGAAAQSYALGFLTHYAFDSVAHPYVYSQVKLWTEDDPNMSRRDAHAHIETALDVILLRYLRGQIPQELPLKRIYPRLGSEESDIAEMLTFAAHRTFGVSVPTALWIQAMKDFRLTQRLLNDPTLLKKPFLARAERLFRRRTVSPSAYIRPISEGDDDFANIHHESWYNPFEENPQPHTEDFFALYHKALARSKALIDGFTNSMGDSAIDLYTLTGDLSYETGLPVRTEKNDFDTLL